MKRMLLGLVCLVGLAPAVRTRAETPEELSQTARYVAAFQNPDGGFAAKPGDKSSLGATSSAIRILKHVGGSIPDVLGCIKYVKSCRDADSGGFATTPGGKPDVRTTAVGLMAVAELKIADDATNDGAVAYFSKNVKGFEDIRIAVAGLEAIEKTSPDFAKWAAEVEGMRNADGTWGQGPGQARDTGGAAAALLRMGMKLEKRDAVLSAMRSAQRADGAWSKDGSAPDFETTYRIMRCFFMLKETPNLDTLRGFIARCRQSDGGYAPSPGGAAELSSTYYATIVLRWIRLLSGEPTLVETAGFVPLFNGRDLSGWEGDTNLWTVRDGMLVGKSEGLKHNDFLATEKSYGDFMLKLTFRMIGGEKSNSGVQFRSVRIPNHEMYGYQADIGPNYWGCLYDESRRKKVLVPASDKALAKLNKTGWNHYEIRAMGDQIRLTLNGVPSVQYREEDPTIARDGKIAVQIHAGGPMEIQFKDIYIQPLPRPSADDSDSPGFHLRTVKTDRGERKYSVFLPSGYDGKKAFPVALFLHGAGERGEDGVMSAQVGLGAAINQHPEDYPLIVVFPQARKTWMADSDDARDALAALDDVLDRFKADRKKVILTGLSMGGSGSWSIAAAHPERFAAVAPVCGSGRPEMVPALKSLPFWTFVGDADRPTLGLRTMVVALKDAGASPRITEYRGVGHNSWDRAYNDPNLIDWMLAQSRK
jgi:prenyltransferase beta subunit/pimeloyl-ACP methyl ester carboxylesterase